MMKYNHSIQPLSTKSDWSSVYTRINSEVACLHPITDFGTNKNVVEIHF